MKNKPVFVWVILSFAYFATRLINLKILPIFTDEAIYSFWAQVALHDPANRFISLEDGKQPLFIWIAATFQKFISDPLIATRLVSVFAGFGSLIGIYLVSNLLFNNKKIAWTACFLYIIFPFTLLYDRMGIFDSLLTMIGIWAVFFSVKMAKDPKLDLAMLNGITIGLGLITKSSAEFYLYLLPFSLIFFNFSKKDRSNRFYHWLGWSAITFLIAEVIYNSLRLSQFFYIIGRKNMEFIRSVSEVIKNPLEFSVSNFHALTQWVYTYMGAVFFFVFLAGLIYGLYKRKHQIIYLAVLIFAPFSAEVIFNKVLYARFALFYFPYVIIILSFTIVTLFELFSKYKKVIIAIVILGLIVPLSTSFFLLTNPPKANIADNDKNQYINDWPAGYGVSEIINILKQESSKGDVYVGTEGTFGLYPYSLQVYFYSNPNVHIYGYWPVDANSLPKQIIDFSKDYKTYFIYNFTQASIADKHTHLVAKYQKGSGNSYMRLFQVEYDR